MVEAAERMKAMRKRRITTLTFHGTKVGRARIKVGSFELNGSTVTRITRITRIHAPATGTESHYAAVWEKVPSRAHHPKGWWRGCTSAA
jgi:hypothetical protein